MSDLRDRILAFLRDHPECSTEFIKRNIGSKPENVSRVLSDLAAERLITFITGGHNRRIWRRTDGH